MIGSTRRIAADRCALDAEHRVDALLDVNVVNLYPKTRVAIRLVAVGCTEGIGKGERCGPVIGGVTGSF